MTKADLVLRLLDYAVYQDVYASVLATLARGVKGAIDRIKKADEEGHQEFADAVVDDETEVIEALLGTAFVLCQTAITAVTEAALQARAQALADGLGFSAFGEKGHEIRALGESFNGQYRKIEVLWALANYFKHRDEWSCSTWSEPTGDVQFTMGAIKAVGLEMSSSGNPRRGSESPGQP